jgi:hypothetical protein
MKAKQFLIIVGAIILAIAGVFLVKGLSGEPASTFKHTPADTAVTYASYVDAQTLDARLTIVKRIAIDTASIDSISPGIYKKVQKRDSFYLIPVLIPAKDSIGQPLKDSLGRQLQNFQWQWLDKTLLLQDFNKRYNWKLRD